MKDRTRIPFVARYLAPALLLYGLFVIWPLIQSFQVSMYRWRGISAKRTYLGVGNYKRLFLEDPVFIQTIKNNVFLLSVCGLAVIAISVSVALAMQGRGRDVKFLRSVFLIPQVLSLTVVAILWRFIYNPNFGLVPALTQMLGYGKVAFLGGRSTALAAVALAFIWYAVGFYIMLFSAGLRQIPEEINEAAMLDGATPAQRFWRVTWPLLWSVKRTAVIYLAITISNLFSLVFLMTEGKPDRATEMPLTYLYEQAFVNSEFGYATSIAVVNFVFVMLLSGAIMSAFRNDPTQRRRAS